jgi:hypothetical protein
MPNKMTKTIGNAVDSAVGGAGKGLGKGLGKLLNQTILGGFTKDVGTGLGESLFEGSKHAGTAGKVLGYAGQAGGALAGANYLLGPALRGMYNKFSGSEKPKKAVSQEDRKWREKISSKVTGGIVGDFKTEDLDSFSNNQDEGFRAGLKGIKKEHYTKLVTDAIKNDDPVSVWNEAARAAKAAGKNINTSKPLYLPQTFKKGGKTFAYAIDASEVAKGQKPKFVPIEIGKGVNWGDSE